MTQQTTNFWPLVSIASSVMTVIIGALLARWTAGIVQNIKSDIRIAILELENRHSKEYASKDYVDHQVKLVERIDEGFAGLNKRFRTREPEHVGGGRG